MPRSTQDFDFTQLSVDERTLLAHRLLESVQHDVEAMPLSAEQRTEVERRVADADAGWMAFLPWEAVKLRLKNRK